MLSNAHIPRELTVIHEDFGQPWSLKMIEILVRAKKQVEARIAQCEENNCQEA